MDLVGGKADQEKEEMAMNNEINATVNTMKWFARRPKGFDIDTRTESVACLHRNRSVCAECAETTLNIVEVYGEWFWFRSAQEVGAMLNSLLDTADREDLDGYTPAWIEARFAAVEAATGKNVRNCRYGN
jgi:hypothetical protein